MAYNDFAEIYDNLMTDIPYEDWCRYLVSLLREQGVKEGLVAELGCGTGTMTELLADAGYDMTGIDLSPEMLQKAIEKHEIRKEANEKLEANRKTAGNDKAQKEPADILYLNQDMRAFELYGTMAAFVSVCDSMNYLTEDEDFIETLRLVNNYLDPRGVFIFDLKTRHYYEKTLGTVTQAFEDGNGFYVWDNEFDETENLNYYNLTWFLSQEDGRYERGDEEQVQRAFSLEEIKRFSEEAGMEFIGAYQAFTKNEPASDDDRIYIVLRERGKCHE